MTWVLLWLICVISGSIFLTLFERYQCPVCGSKDTETGEVFLDWHCRKCGYTWSEK